MSVTPVEGPNLVANIFTDASGLVGRVALDHEGRAIFTSTAALVLRDTTVYDEKGAINPRDGARYIAAIPNTLNGTHLWATLDVMDWVIDAGDEKAKRGSSGHWRDQPRVPAGNPTGGEWTRQHGLPGMAGIGAGRLVPGGTFRAEPGGNRVGGGTGGGGGATAQASTGGADDNLNDFHAQNAQRLYQQGAVDGPGFDELLTNADLVIDESRNIGGSSEVYRGKITMPDGSEADVFVKPKNGLHQGEIHEAITPGQDIEHERAALILNRHLGSDVNMPAQVIRDTDAGLAGVQIGGSGTPMKDIDFYDKIDHEAVGPDGLLIRAHLPESVDGKSMADVALFDAVIGNYDRHGGNLLVDDNGKITAIDHGLAFPKHNDAPWLWNTDSLNGAWATGNGHLTPDQQNKLIRMQQDQESISRALRAQGISDESIGAMYERIDAMLHVNRLPTPDEYQNGMVERLMALPGADGVDYAGGGPGTGFSPSFRAAAAVPNPPVVTHGAFSGPGVPAAASNANPGGFSSALRAAGPPAPRAGFVDPRPTPVSPITNAAGIQAAYASAARRGDPHPGANAPKRIRDAWHIRNGMLPTGPNGTAPAAGRSRPVAASPAAPRRVTPVAASPAAPRRVTPVQASPGYRTERPEDSWMPGSDAPTHIRNQMRGGYTEG